MTYDYYYYYHSPLASRTVCSNAYNLYISKVDQSHYRPEVPRRFQEVKVMAQNGGKVVSLTHRQFLPPGNTPGTHFC